jgi:hypothetical protein
VVIMTKRPSMDQAQNCSSEPGTPRSNVGAHLTALLDFIDRNYWDKVDDPIIGIFCVSC